MCCEPVLGTGAPIPLDVSTTSTHLDLPPDPLAPQRARAFVRQHAGPALTQALAPAVELLVSELVTNVVLHARTPLQLGVTLSPELVLVAVGDGDRAMPEQKPYSGDRLGGRGLLLVDGLSDEWGIERHDAGKTTWFALRRPASEE